MNPNEINYYSLYHIYQKLGNKNNYVSSFRIIGNIKNALKYYKNLIFPKCSYFTQYDFDILPNWQAEININ